MRQWNLSRFDQLEETVLQRSPTKDVVGRMHTTGPRRTSSSLRIAMRVAALGVAALSINTGVGTSATLDFRTTESGIVLNIAREEAPLESVFGKRFGPDWTRESEEHLLAKVVDARRKVSDDSELINFVHSSQQEGLADKEPRIAPRDVLKLVRRKA